MRKVILILLFTIFCSSFSFAGTSDEIKISDVNNIFMWKMEDEPWKEYTRKKYTIKETEQLKSSMYRQKNRRLARCLYGDIKDYNEHEKCSARIIRNLLKKSEINKRRKPGDIFYALDAITVLLPGDRPPRVLDHHWLTEAEEYKIQPGWNCNLVEPVNGMTRISCASYTKSFKKKLEKFKNDPTNEKVLGRPVVQYIKNTKLLYKIIEKIGYNNHGYFPPFLQSKIGITLDRFENRNINLSHYSLIADMLNESVADVKKNNVNPEIKKRRVLLEKYSLILKNIKEKQDKDKFKSIDKDVSKLSKTYKTLQELEKNSNEITVNIDEAVNIIFDLNELILKSSLNSKDNEYKKLLSLASISFMQHLIDSILSIIPEKYIVETKVLKKHLFNEYDLKNIESFINVMGTNNKKFKIDELTKSADKINKYINTSDIKEKLSNLGIKNILEKEITINSTVKSAELEIRDNLSQELFKEAKSILNNLDSNELSDINKEISEVADAVASDPSFKESTSDSILDKNFGGTVTVKQLIGAARNR